MVKLIIDDGMLSANSLEEILPHVFPATVIISRLYGKQFVIDNWDDLLAYKRIVHELTDIRSVSVQIVHIVS